jgi:hypothetical protein
MNGDEIKAQPIGNWHFLFDPTGIGADASQYGFQTGSVIRHLQWEKAVLERD